MKLVKCEHQIAYWFMLTFENGETKAVDLESLISSYVALEFVETACVNQEWGCLEFKAGMVDIEPKTLYKYATGFPTCEENYFENTSPVE